MTTLTAKGDAMSRLCNWLGIGCPREHDPSTHDVIQALGRLGDRIDGVTDAIRRVNYEEESGIWPRDMIAGKYRPHTPRAARPSRKRPDHA
jgi:hypothetical protein